MAERMKAQVFYEPERMRLEELPVPAVSAVDILVRVKTCGVCGSDLSYYYGTAPVGTSTGRGPLVLGHEFTGEVVEVGDVPRTMRLFTPGDRVVINPVQQCNACAAGHTHMCPNKVVSGVSVDGGFAEYCVSRYTSAFRLPDTVSFSAGAFIEPLACVIHGFQKLAIQPGQVVAVFGPGPMGLLMVQLAKRMGAGKAALIGTRDDRLEVGRCCGADHLFNIRQPGSPYFAQDLKAAIAAVTHGRLADRAILATSSAEAFAQALDATGELAIVVYFGLPGPGEVLKVPALPCKMMEKEIRFARVAPLAWPTAIRVLAEGLVDVDALLSGSVSLEQGDEAIRMMKERTGHTIKMQITP